MGIIKKFRDKSNALIATAATTIPMAFATTFPYAEEETIFTKGEAIANELYKDIVGVTLVCGGVCATVCLFTMLFSKDEKAVGSSISWLKRIVIIVVAIILMSTILATITSLVGNGEGASLL